MPRIAATAPSSGSRRRTSRTTCSRASCSATSAGAFTGAVSGKRGLLEVAADGTVYLDEVSSLSLAGQAKFLRVLQERTFRRLGGVVVHPFRARLVVSSRRDLSVLVAREGLPRRLLLPDRRRLRRAAAARRPARGHPAARPPVPEAIRPRIRAPGAAIFGRCRRASLPPPVAGQRPGALSRRREGDADRRIRGPVGRGPSGVGLVRFAPVAARVGGRAALDSEGAVRRLRRRDPPPRRRQPFARRQAPRRLAEVPLGEGPEEGSRDSAEDAARAREEITRAGKEFAECRRGSSIIAGSKNSSRSKCNGGTEGRPRNAIVDRCARPRGTSGSWRNTGVCSR